MNDHRHTRLHPDRQPAATGAALLCLVLAVGPMPGAAAEAPRPVGLSAWGTHQQRDYRVTGLRAFAGGFPVPGLDADAIAGIDNTVTQVAAKLDAWLLPWLNLHALLGHLSGKADATLAPAFAPMLGGVHSLRVEYDGILYGVGATLAAGAGPVFGSVTAAYTRADVDIDPPAGLAADNPRGIETIVIQPKIGLRFEPFSAWIGGYYQFTEHTQRATFRFPPPMGEVRAEVDVRDADRWGGLAGAQLDFGDRWNAVVEVSFGNGTQVTAGVGFRF